MTLPDDISRRNRDAASAVSTDPICHNHEEGGEIDKSPEASDAKLGRTVLRNPNHVCDQGAKFIKTYLRARRDREWQFPRGLFSDPAWDILLDLYVAQCEGRLVSMWDACQAAAVAETSGMRWLRILESRRLVKRYEDMADPDRELVRLTRDAIAGMNRWLDRMHPLPASD